MVSFLLYYYNPTRVSRSLHIITDHISALRSNLNALAKDLVLDQFIRSQSLILSRIDIHTHRPFILALCVFSDRMFFIFIFSVLLLDLSSELIGSVSSSTGCDGFGIVDVFFGLGSADLGFLCSGSSGASGFGDFGFLGLTCVGFVVRVVSGRGAGESGGGGVRGRKEWFALSGVGSFLGSSRSGLEMLEKERS